MFKINTGALHQFGWTYFLSSSMFLLPANIWWGIRKRIYLCKSDLSLGIIIFWKRASQYSSSLSWENRRLGYIYMFLLFPYWALFGENESNKIEFCQRKLQEKPTQNTLKEDIRLFVADLHIYYESVLEVTLTRIDCCDGRQHFQDGFDTAWVTPRLSGAHLSILF